MDTLSPHSVFIDYRRRKELLYISQYEQSLEITFSQEPKVETTKTYEDYEYLGLQYDIKTIVREMNKMNKTLQKLIEKVNKILEREEDLEEIEIRDIPKEQAKQEIKKLFQESKGEVLYWSDIQIKLKLDYWLVKEICEELIKEGAICEG